MYGVDSVKKSSTCKGCRVRGLDTSQEEGKVVFRRQSQYDLGIKTDRWLLERKPRSGAYIQDCGSHDHQGFDQNRQSTQTVQTANGSAVTLIARAYLRHICAISARTSAIKTTF